MIKLLLPALIAITLAASSMMFSTETKADSLVCQYFMNGKHKTLIYTEISDAEDNEIKVVTASKVITFGNGTQILFYVSNDTDCIFFDDPIDGKQTALNYFLSQLNIRLE